MTKVKGPTQPQAETLGHIRAYIAEKGYSPSVADLAKLAGVRSFAMQDRLAALERKGLIARAPGVARSIRPV